MNTGSNQHIAKRVPLERSPITASTASHARGQRIHGNASIGMTDRYHHQGRA